MNKMIALTCVTIMSCCLLLMPVILQAETASGNIITITAVCTYPFKYGRQTVTAECKLTVMSPAEPGAGPEEQPVYITGCWRPVATDDGQTTYVFYAPLATGRLVRAFVWDNGTKKLVDGIQAADGSVVVNGKAYERVPGM